MRGAVAWLRSHKEKHLLLRGEAGLKDEPAPRQRLGSATTSSSRSVRRPALGEGVAGTSPSINQACGGLQESVREQLLVLPLADGRKLPR